MVIEKERISIRAYDNQDANERIVINYSSVTYENAYSQWSAVSKFFVFCKDSHFYINVDSCEIESEIGSVLSTIETRNYLVQKIGRVGQREILFSAKFKNKFKMLFEDRLKSLRIIENDYEMEKVKGSLFKRNHVILDYLEYIEKI
jgi:hypothetical protein